MKKISLQLPGSIIPENEWDHLLEAFESAEDTRSEEFKEWFYTDLKELKDKYCVGENEDTCLLCGNHHINRTGLCVTCAGAYRDRGVLRQKGRTHTYKLNETPCVVCGRPVFSTGLCRSCYYRKKYYKIKTNEEFIEHENKVKTFPDEKFILHKISEE